MYTEVEKAIHFATIAHDGQRRKNEDIPMIFHPISVGFMLKEYGCKDGIVIAGILHDIIEDTKYTYEDITSQFGESVARLVQYASEPDKSLSWQQRKQHTLEYTKTIPLDAKLIVVCDKISNLSSEHDNYQAIGDRIWDKLKEGRNKQEWYYRGILDSVRYNEENNLLFDRYEEILNYLFKH